MALAGLRLAYSSVSEAQLSVCAALQAFNSAKTDSIS